MNNLIISAYVMLMVFGGTLFVADQINKNNGINMLEAILDQQCIVEDINFVVCD